jgi:phosphoribosylformylglycinamidine cyclo-ligase
MSEKATLHFDYAPLDTAKRFAQTQAKTTSDNLLRFGFQEISESRGEAAYVFDMGPWYGALVAEGLGTKNIVADTLYQLYGARTYYDSIAQDTVAMITNDLITVGASPVVVSPIWASGTSDWFKDEKRAHDLISGWTAALNKIGATYGGGETAALAGIVERSRIELSGFGFGIIPRERLCLGEKLTAGDYIVVVVSSGVHANGLTKVREVAEYLDRKLLTPLSDGISLGEKLLKPTHLYAPLTEALHESGVDIHYMANITGHGWAKIMRSSKDYTYRMHTIPTVPEELSFIQATAGMSSREAYRTFNMGAGFALFVDKADASSVTKIAATLGFSSFVGGVVEAGERKVIIEPIQIEYLPKELAIR